MKQLYVEDFGQKTIQKYLFLKNPDQLTQLQYSQLSLKVKFLLNQICQELPNKLLVNQETFFQTNLLHLTKKIRYPVLKNQLRKLEFQKCFFWKAPLYLFFETSRKLCFNLRRFKNILAFHYMYFE